MKRRYYLFLATLVFALLAACGDNNENDNSNEDIFSSVAKHKDEVENYEFELDSETTFTNEETEDVLQSNQALMISEYFETKQQSAGTLQSNNDDVDTVIEYYDVDDMAYANINGQGWEDVTGGDLITDDHSQNYDAIANLISDIKDDVDVTSDDSSYLFTFQGQNETVYNAFEAPYSITLSGITPSELEQDVEIKVDKETAFVEYVKNTITGANDGVEVEFLIDHQFNNINEIAEIKIPQEVIDEVES